MVELVFNLNDQLSEVKQGKFNICFIQGTAIIGGNDFKQIDLPSGRNKRSGIEVGRIMG